MSARMASYSAAALVALLVLGCEDDPPPVAETAPPPETAAADPEPHEPTAPTGDPLPERTRTLGLGGVHTCDLTQDGHVRCWGNNQFGQLGDPAFGRDYDAHRSEPTTVPGLADVRALAVGNFHSCVLGAEHDVRCWGHDAWGQSGGSGADDVLTPTLIAGLERPVALSLGRQHTCARLADRTVACFGDNGWGQLGDGTTEKREGPVTVTGLADVVAISAGRDHTCALTDAGAVSCWGAAVDGELGGGARGVPFSATPVALAEVPEGVTAISAGGLHSCLLAAGVVYCWGANDAHQIGNGGGGEQDDRVNRPARARDLEDVVEIASGGRHTCARKSDGTVHCWGANHFGQLGDGTKEGENRPVPVRGLDDATHLAAGVRHTCVSRARGDQVCWGRNRLGQLGDGTEDDISVGVIVGGGGRIAEPDEEPRNGRRRASPTPSPTPSPGRSPSPGPSPSPSSSPSPNPSPSPSLNPSPSPSSSPSPNPSPSPSLNPSPSPSR